VTGMDLVGVAKELLALAVSSKVRSSISGRQAKAAFWAACRRFFGIDSPFLFVATDRRHTEHCQGSTLRLYFVKCVYSPLFSLIVPFLLPPVTGSPFLLSLY
jgi:hypothetical protein